MGSEMCIRDRAGKAAVAAIRPEDIRVSVKEEKGSFTGEVYSVLPAGAEVILQVKKGSLILTIREMGQTPFDMGDKVYLYFLPESVTLYDEGSGELLYPHLHSS